MFGHFLDMHKYSFLIFSFSFFMMYLSYLAKKQLDSLYRIKEITNLRSYTVMRESIYERYVRTKLMSILLFIISVIFFIFNK